MAVRQLENSNVLHAFGAERSRNDMEKSTNVESTGRTGRLQLVLPEQSFRRLDALKETTEAASYAEVIRTALRIYEGLLVEKQEGSDLVVRRKDGNEIQIPLKLAIR